MNDNNKDLNIKQTTKESVQLKDSNSFVISISEDRLKLFYAIFKNTCGIKPIHIEGVCDKKYNPIKNTSFSHLKCITTAKKYDLDYVVVFEDDAYPCENIINKFKYYTQNIPQDIKFLQLGWSRYPQKETQDFSKDINKLTTRFSGAHSYIVFKNGYDDFINSFSKIDKTSYSITDENYFADLGMCKIFINNGGYVTKEPLFIQFNKNRSMNGHIGYIFEHMGSSTPPKGFKKLNEIIV